MKAVRSVIASNGVPTPNEDGRIAQGDGKKGREQNVISWVGLQSKSRVLWVIIYPAIHQKPSIRHREITFPGHKNTIPRMFHNHIVQLAILLFYTL